MKILSDEKENEIANIAKGIGLHTKLISYMSGFVNLYSGPIF